MRLAILFSLMLLFSSLPVQALADEGNVRYIEVNGSSEFEIVPDKIHYIIVIREYFKEEFELHSKPEDYRTKVPLQQIERNLRNSLRIAGINDRDICTHEVGDGWRRQGQDFCVSKQFDITLTDFAQIDRIIKQIDTKGIENMRIGKLENADMLSWHKKGKIAALKAATEKARYLVEAAGRKLGKVIRIVEGDSFDARNCVSPQTNFYASNALTFENFRTIKMKYTMTVRFEIEE